MSRRPAGLPFVLVTLLLDVLGFGLIIPTLPLLVSGFSGGDAGTAAGHLALMLSVFSATQLLFAPVLGALSDRYGRRPIILGSVLGAALDYLLMAFAPGLGWLFAGRFVAGLSAANITAVNAYVADVSAPEDRARHYGLMGAVYALGFVLGPALGGLLGEAHPRLPFLFAAALAGVSFLYGLLVLPESHPPDRRRPLSWTGLSPLHALGVLRRLPQGAALSATVACTGLALGALQGVWVLYTGYRFGWGALENGLALGALGLGSALAQALLLPRLLGWLGERRTLLWGLALQGGSFVVNGLAWEGWMLYAGMGLSALGGVAGPTLQGLVSRRAGPEEQGAVQGAVSGLNGLTAVVAPLIGAALFGWFTGPGAVREVPGAPFFFGGLALAAGGAAARRALRAS